MPGFPLKSLEKAVLCGCSELWMWKTGRKMDLQTRSGPKGGGSMLKAAFHIRIKSGCYWKNSHPLEDSGVPAGSHLKREPGSKAASTPNGAGAGGRPPEGAVQTRWARVSVTGPCPVQTQRVPSQGWRERSLWTKFVSFSWEKIIHNIFFRNLLRVKFASCKLL